MMKIPNVEKHGRPAFQIGRKFPYRIYGLDAAHIADWYRHVSHIRARKTSNGRAP